MFSFTIACAALLASLVLLDLAREDLREAGHRYALHAHRDALIRLGAGGVLDPRTPAFLEMLRDVDALLRGEQVVLPRLEAEPLNPELRRIRDALREVSRGRFFTEREEELAGG